MIGTEQVERAAFALMCAQTNWADGDRTPQTVKHEHWMRMNPAIKEQYYGVSSISWVCLPPLEQVIEIIDDHRYGCNQTPLVGGYHLAHLSGLLRRGRLLGIRLAMGAQRFTNDDIARAARCFNSSHRWER